MTGGVAAAGGFALGLAVGSFAEWLVHLLMHRRVLLGALHARHHRDGTADGVLWEAAYYLAGAVPAGLLVLLAGWWVGLAPAAAGVAVGGVVYAAFAGYAHQLQHERPELVFWMRVPVHHAHHAHRMWGANFGIGVDVWDRLFGTYRPVPAGAGGRAGRGRVRDYLRVRWV